MVIHVLQDMVVPFVFFQQYTNPFVDLDQKDGNHTCVFSSENGHRFSSEKLEDVKQEAIVKIEG